MAQVKDVPRAATDAGHEGPGLLFHRRPIGAEDNRVKIALERTPSASQVSEGARQSRASTSALRVICGARAGLPVLKYTTGTASGRALSVAMRRSLHRAVGEVLEVHRAPAHPPKNQTTVRTAPRPRFAAQDKRLPRPQAIHQNAPGLRSVIHQTLTVKVVADPPFDGVDARVKAPAKPMRGMLAGSPSWQNRTVSLM